MTTNILECTKYSLVRIAKFHDEVINEISSVLSGNMSLDKEKARRLAMDDTWNRLVNQIFAKMQEKKLQ